MKKKLFYLLASAAVLSFAYLSITEIGNNSNNKKTNAENYLTENPTDLKHNESKGLSSNKNRPDITAMFPIACFAPGTDPSVIENYYNKQYEVANSLGFNESDFTTNFNIENRWSTTVTDGSGLQQGDVTTLTWSYVSDGTPIPNSCTGSASDPSNLITFLNGLYGSPSVAGDFTTAPWHQIFVQMFNSWSGVSGLEFVYEPNDDTAAVATSPGQAGVRGDIRISGHEVDGNFGILACNYLPNNGDMIIDTADAFFTNNPGTANDPFLGLVNVLAHEIGHGLGILHVCPINQTKLMEPTATLAFEEQQEDDILAINRSYGDRLGDNDNPASAEYLGSNIFAGGSLSRSQLSIDDNNEEDYFSFDLVQSSGVNITLTPTGSTYLDGVQLPTGQCSEGSPFNASTVSDLMVELIDQDGSTVIATADSNGPGVIEALIASLSSTGTYYIRVKQEDNVNNVQMYDIEVSFGNCTNASVPVNIMASSITSSTALLSWDPQDFALYDLRYRESGTTDWTTINDIVSANQTLSGLTELTEYEVQVRSRCSGNTPTAYSPSYFFTTTDITYCDSEGGSVADEFISNVQFVDINNTSADENGGYSDFTAISTDIVQGQDYPITITPTWTGNAFDEAYAVWIDFNQNGIFDPDELVYSEAPTQATPVSGLVSIPIDATLGETRMRVSMKYDGIPDPCENFDFGEVEDYTVNVLDETMSVNSNLFGSDFRLYPNPAINGKFSIRTPNLTGEVTVEMINLLGKNVYSEKLVVQGNQIDVNASDISTGVYIIKLTYGKQTYVSRLIVE